MNLSLSKRFKRILITGGAGFIGSNLVKKLLADKNLRVFNLDKISYSSDKFFINNLENKKNNNYKFLNVDLHNKVNTRNAVETCKPDLIINLAAESHVDKSILNARLFLESNTIGTFNLLDASRNYWEILPIEKKHNFMFLQISTDEVFGSLSKSGKFSEISQYNPSSPYSASKAAGDHFVNAWFKTYGFPCIISNCSNNYGPRQFPEKLIPQIIKKVLSGSKIPIYGNGSNVRDWLYVDDHIEALMLIALKGKPGTRYCIGGDNEKSNLEIVNLICYKLDKIFNKKQKSKELINFVEDRAGHDYRYAVDSSRLKRELNWKPNINLDIGLDKTIKWYINNSDWLNQSYN